MTFRNGFSVDSSLSVKRNLSSHLLANKSGVQLFSMVANCRERELSFL